MIDTMEISKKIIERSKIVASKIDDISIRKRVYALNLAANVAADYITDHGLQTDTNLSLFRIPSFAKNMELADIYINGLRLDVRLSFDGETFCIPKTHEKYDAKPYAYVVVQIEKGLQNANILGFVPASELEEVKSNTEYLGYSTSILKPMTDLRVFLSTIEFKQPVYSASEHEKIKELCAAFADDEISESEKVYFIKHVIACPVCRETFCDTNDFDIVSSHVKHYNELLNDSTLSVLSGNRKEIDEASLASMGVVENAQEINNESEEDSIILPMGAPKLEETQSETNVVEDNTEETQDFDSETKQEEQNTEENTEKQEEQDKDNDEDINNIEENFAIEDLEESLSPELFEDDSVQNNEEQLEELQEPVLSETYEDVQDEPAEQDELSQDVLSVTNTEDEPELLEIENDSDTTVLDEFDLDTIEQAGDLENFEELSETKEETETNIQENEISEIPSLDEEPLAEISGLDEISDIEEADNLQEFDELKEFDIQEDTDELQPDFAGEETEESQQIASVDEKINQENDSEFNENLQEETTNEDFTDVIPEEVVSKAQEPVELVYDDDDDDKDEYENAGTVENNEILAEQGENKEQEEHQEVFDSVNDVQHEETEETEKDISFETESFEDDLHTDNEEMMEQSETETAAQEPENDSDIQQLLDDDLLALLSDDSNQDSEEENSTDSNIENSSEPVEEPSFEDDISNENQQGDETIESLYSDTNIPEAQGNDPAQFELAQEPVSAKTVSATKKIVAAAALFLILAGGSAISWYFNHAKTVQDNSLLDTGNSDGEFFDTQKNANNEEAPAVSQDINKSMTNSFSDKPAAITITKLSWQVSEKLAANSSVKEYLQTAGKNIQMNLQNDLANSADINFNNIIKVSFEIAPDNTMKGMQVLESSGSDQVDEIVLRSIKNTLKYISVPKIKDFKSDYFLTLIINF